MKKANNALMSALSTFREAKARARYYPKDRDALDNLVRAEYALFDARRDLALARAKRDSEARAKRDSEARHEGELLPRDAVAADLQNSPNDYLELTHGTLNPKHLAPVFIKALEYLDMPVPNYDSETLVELWDALDSVAPDGYYFGSNEGDGSAIGYWPTTETTKED